MTSLATPAIHSQHRAYTIAPYDPTLSFGAQEKRPAGITPPAFPYNCRLPQVRFRCDSMPQSDPEHNQNLSNVNGITDG
jgi:hypothetical protein